MEFAAALGLGKLGCLSDRQRMGAAVQAVARVGMPLAQLNRQAMLLNDTHYCLRGSARARRAPAQDVVCLQ